MLTKNDKKQAEDDFIGPSQRLREAREKKGLEIKDVAQQLRLSKQFIIDIENDDYSRISSLVYARGYLRAYAKLLDLSSDEIIDAFKKLGLTDGPSSPNAQVISYSKIKITKKRSHRLRWSSIGIFVVLLVAVALWWHGKNANKPASIDSDVQQITIPASN